MTDFKKILSGGDLRSTGQSDAVAIIIADQDSFDRLFKLLYDEDRIVVMRTADAIEKITLHHPWFLSKYNNEILSLSGTATNKELVWHLAQLIPRLNLNGTTFDKAYKILKSWAINKRNSRIVRANSIQALFELISRNNSREKEFKKMLSEIHRENISSVNARIRKCLRLYQAIKPY